MGSWYDPDGSQPCVWVGIDICESDSWGRGIGTEALKLWIGYLFSNLEIDTVGIGTWSGNERMIRCGEKLGFVLGGAYHRLEEGEG